MGITEVIERMRWQYYITESSEVIETWSNTWSKLQIESQIANIENDALYNILNKYISSKGWILEAGCGLGRWVIHFHQQGSKVVGVDKSDVALKKVKEYERAAKICLADVEDLPFPDEHFVSYISIGVVEHFENGPEKALEEAFRVLQPGGIAFVSVPVLNWIRRLKFPFSLSMQLFYRMRVKKGNYHFFEYHYSLRQVLDFLRAANFEIIELVPLHPSFGLVFDLPFLRRKGSTPEQPELLPLATLLTRILYRFSPWTTSHMVMALARSKKPSL